MDSQLKTGLNMRKLVLCIGLFLFCHVAFANATLVLDARNHAVLPKHFRCSSDTVKSPVNINGLAMLNIAGGGEFSRLGFQKIKQQIKSTQLTIIDLRQESHGFLNGNAISWYGVANAENAGLTSAEIEKRQAALLLQLSTQNLAKVAIILEKSADGHIAKSKIVEFLVHHVASEEEFVRERHVGYQRFYVQDYHAPNATEVDKFVMMASQIKPEQWLYFHCRAGRGRTTTFMVMYDMMQNAKEVSFEDILQRQAAIGGKDLTKLPKPGSLKYKPAVKRLKFLKEFYDYAKENNDRFSTSFSTWQQEKLAFEAYTPAFVIFNPSEMFA